MLGEGLSHRVKEHRVHVSGDSSTLALDLYGYWALFFTESFISITPVFWFYGISEVLA